MVSIAVLYSTKLIEIHTNLSFFHFTCSAVHIYIYFFTFAREQLQHLLENNQPLYTLHCSLLTPTYWLSIRYMFKTSHCHSVLKPITTSLRYKTVQKTSLNNIHCKVRTNIKRSLNNSQFIVQNSKSTFLIPS